MFAWLGMILFFTMFFQMLYVTWLVGSGAENLHQVVKLFWTFKLLWQWAYHGTAVSPWVSQFSFGFYSMMLTSTLIGLIVMVLYKPRRWCVFYPMGTTTQLICKARADKLSTQTKETETVCSDCNKTGGDNNA